MDQEARELGQKLNTGITGRQIIQNQSEGAITQNFVHVFLNSFDIWLLKTREIEGVWRAQDTRGKGGFSLSWRSIFSASTRGPSKSQAKRGQQERPKDVQSLARCRKRSFWVGCSICWSFCHIKRIAQYPLFRKGDDSLALDCYNQAIILAPCDTSTGHGEDLAIAAANRSAVMYRLQKYG